LGGASGAGVAAPARADPIEAGAIATSAKTASVEMRMCKRCMVILLQPMVFHRLRVVSEWRPVFGRL
jgi:hypothetical protein